MYSITPVKAVNTTCSCTLSDPRFGEGDSVNYLQYKVIFKHNLILKWRFGYENR